MTEAIDKAADRGAEAGRSALILGCASGIGAAGARILARRGWKLALLDLAAEGLAEIAAETGAGAHVVDASDPAALAQALTAALAELGRVDAVWSNVGMQTAGTVEAAAVEDLDRCYALNVRAHFVVAQHAVPALREAGGGPLLLTASNAGLFPDRELVTYSATKAATVAMAKLMAVDHAADGVRVNVLCPGWVDTPFNTPAWGTYGGRDEFLAKVPELIPIGRIADAPEVAAVACRLLSDEFAYMTGHAFVLDGGEMLA
ncbi:MAG: SDR family oxidoreductase [Actinobacteria bacterium]|nr:SDR family oxidoreductase [Actinomycetota bacterium]